MHRALSNNLFAVGSFIDIKAAFDSITFSSIMSAIRELNLPPFLTAWIHKFLTTKTVIFNLKGMALIRFIIKGTPQGGVLSPFLWNLVFNSLITKLQDLIKGAFTYDVSKILANFIPPSPLSATVSIERPPPLMTSAFARPPPPPPFQSDISFSKNPLHSTLIETLNVYLIQLKTELCRQFRGVY